MGRAHQAAGKRQPTNPILPARLHHYSGSVGCFEEELTLENPQITLDRCQQALAQAPGDPGLREQLGCALQQCQRHSEAVEIFQALVDELPHRPFLRLRLAVALRLSGDPAGSARQCEQVLQQEPAHRLAFVNLIEAALAAGDADAALRSCGVALGHHPDDPQLLRQQARALRRAGRAIEAVGVLEPLHQAAPHDQALTIELARAYQQAGQRRTAEGLLDGLLRQQQGHLAAALERADLAEQAGDLSTALDVLERAVGPGGLIEADPQLLLRLWGLAHLAGDGDRLRQALQAASALNSNGRLGLWTELQLQRLTNAAGSTWEQTLAGEAIRLLLSRERLQANTALFLVRKAHAVGDHALSARLMEQLVKRVSPGQRDIFSIESTLICDGPEAAYRLAREILPKPRQRVHVQLLARVMRQSGRNPLARRYLALCLRAWPQDVALRRLFAEACIHSGRADQLAPLLAELEASGQAGEAAVLRIQMLLETGALEQTLTVMNEQADQLSPTGLSPSQQLMLYLSLGQLAEAESLVSKNARRLFPTNRGALRMGPTQAGRKLNELRLYAIEAAAGEADPDLAERLVFPAQQVVARWLHDNPAALAPASEPSPAIPRQIMQYWDTPAIPAEVAAVMESWQHAPGFGYTRLDQQGARAFLREEYGQEHLRAFRLANSSAMRSDFLRLCWLQAKGGIYADADDKLIGDPKHLVPGAEGLALWREPWGTILNNLIIARPGHPVLQRAVAMACQALLQGDSDPAWSKTGPSLLTRAVATYLTHISSAEARRDLCIHEQHEAYPIVQMHLRLSYKGTPSYWNAVMRESTAMVRQALAGVTQAPGNPASA